MKSLLTVRSGTNRPIYIRTEAPPTEWQQVRTGDGTIALIQGAMYWQNEEGELVHEAARH